MHGTPYDPYADKGIDLLCLLGLLGEAGEENEEDNMFINGELDLTPGEIEDRIVDARKRLDAPGVLERLMP